MTNLYEHAHAQSLSDPDGFWGKAAEDCHWEKRWDKVLEDSSKPFYRWFSGGEMNTCYNALDHHIDQGRGDQLALIYDSPVTDSITKITYSELQDKVATLAGALQSLGIQKGDTVSNEQTVLARTELCGIWKDERITRSICKGHGTEINRYRPGSRGDVR